MTPATDTAETAQPPTPPGRAASPSAAVPRETRPAGSARRVWPWRRVRWAWRSGQFLVEYLALRTCAGLAGCLPRRVWLECGARFGDVLCLLGCYRRVVRKNMEYVALWPPEEQRRITRQLYRNIGRYAADFLRPTTAPPPTVVEDEDALRRLVPPGQGGIALFAHLGNWEVLPGLVQRLGCTLTVIAKPMRNPWVNRWLQRQREQAGVSFAVPEAALRLCLRVINRDHGLIALAIDQYPGRKGTPTALLGRTTLSVRTSAGLAVHTGCPVIALYALLGDDGAYRISVEAVATPRAEAAAGADPVAETLQAHNDAVSAWVRAHPEHWFGWFHRRFRGAVAY